MSICFLQQVLADVMENPIIDYISLNKNEFWFK